MDIPLQRRIPSSVLQMRVRKVGRAPRQLPSTTTLVTSIQRVHASTTSPVSTIQTSTLVLSDLRKGRIYEEEPGSDGTQAREKEMNVSGQSECPSTARQSLEGFLPFVSALSLQPTYSVIPHAASGRAAHSGRGGFPGLPTIIAHVFRAILPASYTHKVNDYVYDQHAPGLRWAHPFQSVEQAISGPFKNYRDSAEAKEAEKVRWLPPGVRGVVVGRNSQIYDEELDNDDLELFAAIEYKALKVLTYFVIAVSPQ